MYKILASYSQYIRMDQACSAYDHEFVDVVGFTDGTSFEVHLGPAI